MSIKIAILRGINVGGKRIILMADLKTLCEKLGLENVKTYIQSGNLIFSSGSVNTDLERKLEMAITDKYGFDVPAIVRDLEEIKSSIDKNPFFDGDADMDRLHLTFLKEKPNPENAEITTTYDYAPDKFKIDGRDVFIYCAGKYHESKLTNGFFEKKLNTVATTRNWKTVLKLYELSQLK